MLEGVQGDDGLRGCVSGGGDVPSWDSEGWY